MMWKLVVIGVIVHLLLLSAVFDIYFVSPIQHGMTPHKPGGVPPAKRVVLFVADGLRASSLYGSQMKTIAPYLHSVIHYKGSWGISQTQVPTESRPGHVALLAGFNEDPSAITRGWKSNPVEFDTVINQSTNAWCWGSPDIVGIFNKDNLSHIHLHSYDAYMQDFSGRLSPALLDYWVFDKVKLFFKNQARVGCTDFCQDGNVIFLHLLGLDTAGHSYKPTSQSYTENIKIVDEGVQQTVDLFERYFRDSKTAYIFTADHGMTNWGSHGDGSVHETNVPLITWGAGLAYDAWVQDVEQVNIAPLISVLVGINIPVNSLGVVPLNYVDASDAQKAHIMYANARQLSEQYSTKHANLKESMASWIFEPFPGISENSVVRDLEKVNQLIREGNYKNAVNESYLLIDLFKYGLKYYNNYYQRVLLLFVTTGFIGWIVYLFTSIEELGTFDYVYWKFAVFELPIVEALWDIPAEVAGIITVVCLGPLAPSLPLKYYMYCLFPIFTWCMVLDNYKQGLVSIALVTSFGWTKCLWMAVSYICGVELLIFTFFERYYLTALFAYLGYRELIKRGFQFKFWILGHFLLGLSPLLLDLQTTFSYTTQVVSCLLWIYYGLKVCAKPTFREDRPVIAIQLSFLIVAFANSIMVHSLMLDGQGLRIFNQMISWMLLPLSLICPWLTSDRLENRVISAVFALMTPYTLMAVGFENLYMFFFAQHMLNWLSTEHKLKELNNPDIPPLSAYTVHMYMVDGLHTDQYNVKQCFNLLAFIMLSYFGVGNTASMNSFDPMWVKCFVTVFSPFTMAGLILVKLVIPFLIVMCVFQAIMIVNQAQVRNTFLIILLFCDLMVIQLLYFVKNEGSWLEIGVSLSRFIVVNVTTIFLLILYEIAFFLTTKDLNSWTFFRNLRAQFDAIDFEYDYDFEYGYVFEDAEDDNDPAV